MIAEIVSQNFGWTSETDLHALHIVERYAIAAMAVGAAPVPMASTAVIANNTFLCTHVAACYGVAPDLGDIVKRFASVQTLNSVGRMAFVEGTRALSWGAASPWAAVGVSALGASLAGAQTLAFGLLEVALRRSPSAVVSSSQIAEFVKFAQQLIERVIAARRTSPPLALA